jgi:hypothetical protein
LRRGIEQDLTKLKQYCQAVSRATGVPIPANYPVVGDDAFRTATGVHAAAIIKAYHKNDIVLANTVYSGVPSHVFGLEQIIDVGPMSGKSNVLFWLERRGIPATDDVVERIYAARQAERPHPERSGDSGVRARRGTQELKIPTRITFGMTHTCPHHLPLRHAILGAGGVGGLMGACLAHPGAWSRWSSGPSRWRIIPSNFSWKACSAISACRLPSFDRASG